MLQQSRTLNQTGPVPVNHGSKQTAQVWKQRFTDSQSCRLATMAVTAGLITKAEIEEAVEIAHYLGRSMHDSVDSIILSCDQISTEAKELARHALDMVDRGKITEDLAVQGLRISNLKKISFNEGLRYFGFGW